MSDERPRPEYGEYSSPEEQLARMGEAADAAPAAVPPAHDAALIPPALQPPAAPAPGSLGPLPLLDQPPAGLPPFGARPFGGAGTPGAYAPAPGVAAEPPKRTAGAILADRIVTVAFLAYGLVSVLTGIPQYLDLAGIANQSFAAAGIPGEFSNFAQGNTLGALAAFILAAGFALTAWVAVRKLRRGRAAWWVPLVGFVLTFIPIAICLAVALMGDPAFIDYVASQTPQ